MKILYVIHQYFPDNRGGTEQILRRLAQEITTFGETAIICAYSHNRTLEYPKQAGGIQYRKTDFEGIPLIEFTPAEAGRIPEPVLGELLCTEFAKQILREEKPDLVHLMHTIHVGCFAEAAQQEGIPYLCTVTDFWPVCRQVNLMRANGQICEVSEGGKACNEFCGFSAAACAEQQRRQKKRLEGAALVTVPSAFVGQRLQRELGISQIKVVEHGVNREHLHPKQYQTKKRGDTINFSLCAFQTPTKGLQTVISAMSLLDKQPNLRLNVYGGMIGEYGRTMRALAASDGRIRFWGAYTREEQAEIFAGTDMLIIPSLCPETYQLAMREAAVCGVASIGTRSGAIRDFIQEGKNGITFRLGDSLDLAVKMYGIILEPQRMERLGRAAAETFIPTPRQEAAAYREIYQGILVK